MDPVQKKITLFIRLAEVAGYITAEDSIKFQKELRQTTIIQRPDNNLQQSQAGAELDKLIKKINLKQETATLLWQIAKSAPALAKETEFKSVSDSSAKMNESITKTIVALTDVKENLRKEILFAEEMIRRHLVKVEDANVALEEIQKTNSNISLGQALMRKHLITPEQFVQIKQELQQSSEHKVDSRITLNQGTGVFQLTTLDTPKTIGRYEIIREIARGGMGVVYEAKDPQEGTIVALKTMIAGELADEKDIQRFHQEAQLTSKFNHPGIIPIHDVGIYENIHYFTMDYIDGMSLSDYVQKNKLPARKVFKLMLHVADALGYAHGMGVIHRDIKPGNVLVDKSGKPLLTDFGLAKKQQGQGLTMSGVALGTPAYMPPEQAEGRIKDIDARSDIYSFGAVLYELLTGKPPFSGGSLAETLQAVIKQDAIPLRELIPDIPKDIETICMKCLQKEKTKRYPHIKGLIRDMEHFLKGDTIRAQRAGLKDRFVKEFAQNKPVFIAGVVLIVFIVLFACIKIADSYEMRNLRGAISLKNADLIKYNKTLEESEKKFKEALAKAESLQKDKDESLICISYYKGVTLFQTGKYDESIEIFSNIIKIAPKSFEDLYLVYLNRGICYFKKQLYSKALDDINQSISLKNDYASSYDYRVQICFKLERFQDMLEDCNKIISLNPPLSLLIPAYNNRAVAHIQQKSYLKALDDLCRAVQLVPDDPEIRFNRGQIYSMLGDYEKALNDYKFCLESNHRRGEVQQEIQNIKQKLGKPFKPDNKIKENDEIVEKEKLKKLSIEQLKDLISQKYVEGKNLTDRGLLQEGIQALSKCILISTVFPPNVELEDLYTIYSNRGLLFYQTGQIEKALSDYDKSISLKPDFAVAYNLRSLVYRQLKQYSKAIEDATKAISLNPRLADAYNNRAIVYMDQGLPQKSVEDLKQAVLLDAGNFVARFNRGIAYMTLEENQKAIDDFQYCMNHGHRAMDAENNIQIIREKMKKK